jgi:hypothetical protein
MKQLRYWLSFDLGLRGNYEQLYEWLDRMDAKECGDSVATFLSEKTREEITEELSRLLTSDDRGFNGLARPGRPRPRIYLINMKQGGKFILGKRKIAPWAGYSVSEVQAEEEK